MLVIRCSQAVDYERSDSRYRLWDEVDGAPLVSLAILTPGIQQPLYAITQPAGRGSNIPKGIARIPLTSCSKLFSAS